MTIIWARPARDSFISHMEYLTDRTPAAARRVSSAILESIRILQSSPFIGRPGRWPDTRELIIEKFPYIVACRIHVDSIEILYIHHTRQNWPDQ